MDEKEKKYEPKHIKEHNERYKKAKMIKETTDRIHRQAFSEGEEAIINEDGLVDKDMLKDNPEKQLEVEKQHKSRISVAKIIARMDFNRAYYYTLLFWNLIQCQEKSH